MSETVKDKFKSACDASVEKAKQVFTKDNLKSACDASVEKAKQVFTKDNMKNVLNKAKETLVDASRYTASVVKSKEERKSFIEKVKNGSIAAKDKCVAFWNSGWVGKATLVAVAVVILWIVLPFGGKEGTRSGAQLRCGLTKERDSDELFYESGKELVADGDFKYKEVVPNLIKLPSFIQMGMLLETAMLPNCPKQKGDAYRTLGFRLKVVSSGKGHVVVADEVALNGEVTYAYIATDDEYVTGQNLSEGFYAYTGIETVNMTDGSSMSIPAFEKLDSAYVQADEYNATATDAANVENQRRSQAVVEEAHAKQRKAFADAYLEEAKKRRGIDYRKNVHIPSKLKDKIEVKVEQRWKWDNQVLYRRSKNYIGVDDFISRLEQGDWPYYIKEVRWHDSLKGLAESLDSGEMKLVYEWKVKGGEEIYAFVVDPKGAVKRLYEDASDVENWPSVSAEIYFTEASDDFAQSEGKAAFLECYESKYGK